MLGITSRTMVKDPIQTITKFITELRTTKFKYNPHKVLIFKWKGTRYDQAYQDALAWAKKNKFVAIYNTRNELDYLISLAKMRTNNTYYGCHIGDKACVSRNKKSIWICIKDTTRKMLPRTITSNKKYESHVSASYGIPEKGGYVRVHYDKLMYSPRRIERLKFLQEFADNLWNHLSHEAPNRIEEACFQKRSLEMGFEPLFED